MSAPRTVVLGTAGHVDHGKSSLVRALTGTDPDRLAEEKARGLTIDLGFAWLRLPGGDVASFVDVPGHEDFIHNMLAGAGGIGAGLMVIAADEGPMPQTREHLAILDLLDLRQLVVALTKADLVDAAWLDLVRADVAALLAAAGFGDAVPVLAVSATTGAGLPELVAALEGLVGQVAEARDRGRARLSIDRAFSLSGFGTVVTGTLRDGRLGVGAPLVLWPAGQKLRARGVQAHGQAVTEALPGTRTAVNLPGIETGAIRRGDVLTQPEAYHPTRLVDVALRVLPGAPTGFAHGDRLQVYHGAAEIPARVRLVGERPLAPGERGFAQLGLSRSTVMAAGDRLVLRRMSPPATLGGAVVLAAAPRPRRRLRPATHAYFAALASGHPEEMTWAFLADLGPCRAAALTEPDTGLAASARDQALVRLAAAGRARQLADWWCTTERWAELRATITAALEVFHRRYPLRPGMPPETLRARLGLPADCFAAVVQAAAGEGWLRPANEALALASHESSFRPAEAAAVAALLARFEAQPYTPPAQHEAEAAVGTEALAALVGRGELVAVGGDVLFSRAAFDALRAGVIDQVGTHGQVTVADVRDRFGTSRKYALALLEYLDRTRVTRRVGDARVLAGGSRPEPERS